MPEGEERRKEGRKERLRAAAMPLRHRRRRRETGRGENEQRHEQAGGRAGAHAREAVSCLICHSPKNGGGAFVSLGNVSVNSTRGGVERTLSGRKRRGKARRRRELIGAALQRSEGRSRARRRTERETEQRGRNETGHATNSIVQ